MFRDLRADEIECRVGTVSEKGITLLLYKDARCDMAILDETVGAFGWDRKHYEMKGNMFCAVGIYDKENSQWVYKSDCGTESYTEKQKGEASDSFKRACVNWGIGRELYTSPFIFIKGGTVSDVKGFKMQNKFRKFKVSEIEIKDKVITRLVITEKDEEVYVYGKVSKNTATQTISEVKQKTIMELAKKVEQDMDKLLVAYKIGDLSQMTEKQFISCMKTLEIKEKARKVAV